MNFVAHWLRWESSGVAAVSIDVTDHPRLIRDMAISGCTGVFVGFESLSADNIRDAGKKSPLPLARIMQEP